MVLYTNKYCPKYLDDFSFSEHTSKLLKFNTAFNNLENYDIYNMILFGSDGSGKKSRIYAFLREIFNKDVKNITTNLYTLKYKNNKYEYVVYTSPVHIELNLAEHGTNDFYVIKDFIKRIKDTKNIYTNGHRIIIIPYFNKLTKKAQLYFRRTMEMNIDNIRFIFLSNSLLNIEDSLKSRCSIIKIISPSYDEIKSILLDIIEKEDLYIPENKDHREKILKSIIYPNKIIKNMYNLKNCIKHLQLSYRSRDNSFIVYKSHCVTILKDLVKIIKNTKIITKNVIEKINELIYELYTDDVDYKYVLRYLTEELMVLFTKNDTLNPVLMAFINFSSETNHNMCTGKHVNVALENFIYKVFKLKTLV